MSGYPSHKINQDLNAANVIELAIDHSIVMNSHEEAKDVLAGDRFVGTRVSESSGIGLYSYDSGWNGDLRWVSAGNELGFAFFERYFAKLGIERKTKVALGDCGDLIMYSGFYVIRSETTAPYYHYDYMTGVGMNALTFMTPVFPTAGEGNLLYTNTSEEEAIYKYSLGTGISFGAEFYHSTQPFNSDQPYVFLCFTYGVRNPDQWQLIAETVTQQGILYRHPSRGIVSAED